MIRRMTEGYDLSGDLRRRQDDKRWPFSPRRVQQSLYGFSAVRIDWLKPFDVATKKEILTNSHALVNTGRPH